MNGDSYTDWRQIFDDYAKDPAFDHMRDAGSRLVESSGWCEPSGFFFIGEAPGAREDKEGIPFVGKAGRFFDRLLELVNMDRNEVYITNVVKYRPTDGSGNRTPFPSEISSSRRYLKREIDVLNPGVIVPMGKIATSVFFPGKNFWEVRGQIISRNGRLVIPQYHPAFGCYNEDDPEKLDRFKKEFSVIGSLDEWETA